MQHDEQLWTICETLYFPRKTKIRSDRTKILYFYAIKSFGEFLGRPPCLGDLNEDAVLTWMTSLLSRRERKLTIYTVREKVRRVTTLWKWLAHKRHVHEFPTIEFPPPEDPLPRAWTLQELRLLFAAAALEGQAVCGVPGSIYWPARLGWYWLTGERYGATRDLRWEWVNLDAATAAIPAHARKGRRKPAVYRLPPALVVLLRAVKSSQAKGEPLVFPWGGCEWRYWYQFGKIIKRAGLPGGRTSKSQALRITYATWLDLLGGNASQALQHSNPATTKKHYLDPRMRHENDVTLPLPWLPGDGGNYKSGKRNTDDRLPPAA